MVEIRSAKPGDEGAIAQVHVSAWQEAYRGAIPDAYLDALTVHRRTETWRGLLAQLAPPSQDALVAVDGTEVLGFVHFSQSRDPDADATVGEVTSIYVQPGRWREGIGRALLQGAGERLGDAGFSSITLWVLEVNAAARRFYEAEGWRPDAAVKEHERAGVTLRELRYARPAPPRSESVVVLAEPQWRGEVDGGHVSSGAD